VCNAADDISIDIPDGLAVLLDQSLLQQTQGSDGEPRFTMLETIREYALERLAERGEAEALRQRYAEYYLSLAETAEPETQGLQQRTWVERLESEHDNLRAALEYLSAQQAFEQLARLFAAFINNMFWKARSMALQSCGNARHNILKPDYVTFVPGAPKQTCARCRR
jgi:predicted ATPase